MERGAIGARLACEDVRVDAQEIVNRPPETGLLVQLTVERIDRMLPPVDTAAGQWNDGPHG